MKLDDYIDNNNNIIQYPQNLIKPKKENIYDDYLLVYSKQNPVIPINEKERSKSAKDLNSIINKYQATGRSKSNRRPKSFHEYDYKQNKDYQQFIKYFNNEKTTEKTLNKANFQQQNYKQQENKTDVAPKRYSVLRIDQKNSHFNSNNEKSQNKNNNSIKAVQNQHQPVLFKQPDFLKQPNFYDWKIFQTNRQLINSPQFNFKAHPLNQEFSNYYQNSINYTMVSPTDFYSIGYAPVEQYSTTKSFTDLMPIHYSNTIFYPPANTRSPFTIIQPRKTKEIPIINPAVSVKTFNITRYKLLFIFRQQKLLRKKIEAARRVN